MELAQSFHGFVPELHDMLRTAAVQADNDALAQGELQAIKDRAGARVQELDQLISDGVNAGTIPHARAPAFERGYRARAGIELAQSAFQEALLSQLPDATKVDGSADGSELPQTHTRRVEKIVGDTYQQFSSQLHPQDFYAREAFDRTAEGIIAGFRQRAAEDYTAAYKQAGEQKMADDNSERLLNLATSPADQHVTFHQSVKDGLDQMRMELPRAKVNEFYLTNVVAPTVKKLIAQNKYTEARNVLDEIAHLDVTGSGGLLGQTAVGKSVLSDLQAHVDREHRINGQEEFEALQQDVRRRQLTGELAAGKELQDLRLKNAGQLPEDRFKLIDDYRKAHSDDPVAVDGYTSAVNREYEGEARYRTNERAVSDLEVSIKSLRKEDIDSARAKLEGLYALHQISPTDRTRLSDHLDKLSSLYGAYDQSDVERFKRSMYAVPSGITGVPGIAFSPEKEDIKDPTSVSFMWDHLTPELRDAHRARLTEYWQRALENDLVTRVGDPTKVPAEKALSIDRATASAQAYAVPLLRELWKQQTQEAQAKQVQAQAAAIRNAKVTSLGVRPDLGVGYTVPGKETNAGGWAPGYLGAGYKHPGPEADKVSVWIPAASFKEWLLPGAAGTERTVVMSELAQAIREGKDEEKAKKDKALYGYVKSKLGFTPEEVTKGETRDGIPFDAAQIDPQRIAVFRNKAELEKNWNGGEPSPLLQQIGDLLDPSGKLTPAKLYLAQSAIFAARTQLYSNSR